MQYALVLALSNNREPGYGASALLEGMQAGISAFRVGRLSQLFPIGCLGACCRHFCCAPAQTKKDKRTPKQYVHNKFKKKLVKIIQTKTTKQYFQVLNKLLLT